MIRIKFQDLYCHFIVILNQMVMLFLLKIGELSMIMTQMEKNSFFCSFLPLGRCFFYEMEKMLNG